MRSWKTWLHGLAAAFIGGGAAAAPVAVIDPQTFNFSEGFPKLAMVFVASGAVSALAYLKQSPLPPIE